MPAGTRLKGDTLKLETYRHFGKDKVTMDFAFFAIAFNIKKMCAKIKNEKMTDKNYQNIRVA